MKSNEVRCFCPRHTLLARIGVDPKTRHPFIHIKVFKQQRVYGEFVVHSGRVTLRCRDCGRWHEVIIRENLKMVETPPPSVLEKSAV